MSSEGTQFQEGHKGGPGRPKGSRNKLSEEFLKVLAEDFLEHGAEVIGKLREQPAQYANVIAKLMPKLMELSGPDGGPMVVDTDWQLEVVESYICSECKKSERAEGVKSLSPEAG